MNKDFILGYLKPEHLASNDELSEIAELSGMDVVKMLFKNHETMRMLYIPILTNNKMLMSEVIKANRDKMTLAQLAGITGLTRRKVDLYLKELDKHGAA